MESNPHPAAERIKKPILIPFAAILLAMLIAGLSGIHWMRTSHLNQEAEDQFNSAQQLFLNTLEEEGKLLSSMLYSLAEKEQLATPFLAEDRAALFKLAAPIYTEIHDRLGATHLYFHTPDLTCFLRVHNPERFGDRTVRHTLRDAMSSKIMSKGIELGPFGTFTLRTVLPWHVGDKLIGYIEIGKEIDHITPYLKKILGVDLLFLIEKRHIDKSRWEEGLSMLGKSGNWDHLPDHVIIDSTLSELPPTGHEIFTALADPAKVDFFMTSIGDRHFHSRAAPLRDASGYRVGSLVILKDFTREMTAFTAWTYLFITLALGVGGIIFWIFYRRIHGIEARLTEDRIKIIKEVEERRLAEEDKDHALSKLKKTAEQLKEKNSEIRQSREDMQQALSSVSKLIQNVSHEMDFYIRFDNPHLQPCYTVMNCKDTSCECYGHGPTRCWQVEGTFCGGEPQGDFVKKFNTCTDCQVFKQATENSIYQIGEHFNNMMHILELKNKELHETNKELHASQRQTIQQEKMASIGLLAAGVAHEINNPVGFVASNLSTLSKYIDRLTEAFAGQSEIIKQLTGREEIPEIANYCKEQKLDFIVADSQDLISESLAGTERISTIVNNLQNFSREDTTVRER